MHRLKVKENKYKNSTKSDNHKEKTEKRYWRLQTKAQNNYRCLNKELEYSFVLI